MWHRIVLCVVLGGCGFQSPASGGAGHDAATDSATIGDASPGDGGGGGSANCLGQWLDGTLTISAPQELTSLSTTSSERDPWISGDRLTLYFASNRGGSNDIYRATRTLPTLAFDAPTLLVNLSVTDKEEDRAALTADEKTLVLSSDRAANGKIEIYITTRPDTGQEFGSPNQDHLDNVNADNAPHYDPFLTADGLKLYLAPDPSGPAHQQIVVATRTSANSDFTTPMLVRGIDVTGAGNADPSLSRDERIIVFSSDRAGGLGQGDLWYATRPDTAHDFGTPALIPMVNSGQHDGDPMLSADGCELYFSSTRNRGDFDLYSAQITR